MQAKMHVAACIFDAKTYQGQAKTIIESPLGRAHRRPSIFDRRVWVPMCEDEHAIDNRRLLEALEKPEDVLGGFG